MTISEIDRVFNIPLFTNSEQALETITPNNVKNSRTILNGPNFLHANKVPRKIEFFQSKLENTLERTKTNKINESGFVYTFTSWHSEDNEDLRLTGVNTSLYSVTNKTLMRKRQHYASIVQEKGMDISRFVPLAGYYDGQIIGSWQPPVNDMKSLLLLSLKLLLLLWFFIVLVTSWFYLNFNLTIEILQCNYINKTSQIIFSESRTRYEIIWVEYAEHKEIRGTEKEISYNVDVMCVPLSIKNKFQSKQSECIHMVFQGNERSVLIEADNAPALGTARRKPTYSDPLAYIARKARYLYRSWEMSERAYFSKKMLKTFYLQEYKMYYPSVKWQW